MNNETHEEDRQEAINDARAQRQEELRYIASEVHIVRGEN